MGDLGAFVGRVFGRWEGVLAVIAGTGTGTVGMGMGM